MILYSTDGRQMYYYNCLVRAVSATNPPWNLYVVRNIVLVCLRRVYRRRRTRSHRKGSIIAATTAKGCARTVQPRNRPRTLRHPPPPPVDPVIRFRGASPTLGDPVSADDTVTYFSGDLPATHQHGGLFFDGCVPNKCV